MENSLKAIHLRCLLLSLLLCNRTQYHCHSLLYHQSPSRHLLPFPLDLQPLHYHQSLTHPLHYHQSLTRLYLHYRQLLTHLSPTHQYQVHI
ncbi:unnamed protein product [Cylicostephanus goldi]|uniref:Secreted protein n=1 Tax=Cylicostephanus goldi TaxID=71465 RepID=A0A3P6SVT6_CYLGO|nr:unnamed protein product [Cylicostephanus goldi]